MKEGRGRGQSESGEKKAKGGGRKTKRVNEKSRWSV